MKQLFLAAVILFSLELFAQTETKSKKTIIPTEAKNAFAKEFPNKKAKWGAENGGYEAEFKINGIDASAVYDKTGNRKELEINMEIKDLQPSISEYIKQNYPKSKITEAAKITNDKNTIAYEAEIKKDGKSYDVLFDVAGKFIKTVKGD